MSTETVGDRLPEPLQPLRNWAAGERVGSNIHVTQARIDAFADATGDHNWIHVDQERARTSLPGGQTIAHGFLLLALTIDEDVVALTGFAGIAHVLNYGLNKVRFLAPVASGSQVRIRSRLLSLEPRSAGQWLLTQHKTVEVMPAGEVAVVAEQLALIVLADPP